jgi:hypothetical protein
MEICRRAAMFADFLEMITGMINNQQNLETARIADLVIPCKLEAGAIVSYRNHFSLYEICGYNASEDSHYDFCRLFGSMPCSLVNGYQRFEEVYSIPLHFYLETEQDRFWVWSSVLYS